GGEGGGQAGGPLDHGGEVVLGHLALAGQRRVAEAAQHGGGGGGGTHRLGGGQVRHRPPDVDPVRPAAATPATPPLLPPRGVHAGTSSVVVSSSVSSAPASRPRAARSWLASRSDSELDFGSTRSAMWRLPATTSSTRSSTVPGHTRRCEMTV